MLPVMGWHRGRATLLVDATSEPLVGGLRAVGQSLLGVWYTACYRWGERCVGMLPLLGPIDVQSHCGSI